MKKEKNTAPAPEIPADKKPGHVWPYLVEALLEAALAAILFIWKDDGAFILRIVLSAVLILTGIVNISRYVAGKFTDFGLELLGGTVLLGLGLSFIIHADDYGTLFMLILILLIITDSLVDLRRAFLLKEHEFTFWYVLLFFSVAAVVLSILLYFWPGMFGDRILYVIGGVLVYEAVSTVLTTLCFFAMRGREMRKLKNLAKQEAANAPEPAAAPAGDPPVPEGFDDTTEMVEP